jgi:hypothetical protein
MYKYFYFAQGGGRLIPLLFFLEGFPEKTPGISPIWLASLKHFLETRAKDFFCTAKKVAASFTEKFWRSGGW